MSLCILKDRLENLKLLKELPADELSELCNLSIDFLKAGPKNERHPKIADSVESLNSMIKTLVLLLTDVTKSNVNQSEFETSLKMILSTKQLSVLWQHVVDNKIFIHNTLRSHNVKSYRYRDLSWRIETRISSRCLLHQVTPIATVLLTVDSEQINENRTKLALVNDNLFSSTAKTILFQIDPTNLVHIIDILEVALAESKTHRTRNTLKAFQVNK
ncbi:COMM domain-containing protein 2 [Pseudolycoriella hygida]|uniref:COMM domain-containing protein 2 n=1 Tax=Pseudolycoriella hygida TaxID=35572 RepID=A0A9Q0RV88_9DIPT|nr:COMM domain-containing protein 2 [Pseudolycoriella hygida]